MFFIRKVSFLPLLLISLFFAPHPPVHGQPPLHRRSLAFKMGLHRRLEIPPVVSNLPNGVVDNVLGNSSGSGTSSSPPGTSPSSSPSSTDPPTTTNPPATTHPPEALPLLPPATDPPSSPPTTTSSSNPPSSPPTTSPSSTTSSPSSSPSTTSSTSSSPSSTTSPPSSSPTTSSSTSSSDTPSPPPIPFVTTPLVPSATPTTSCPLGLDPSGNCILPPPTSSPATSQSTSTSTTQPSTPPSPSSPQTSPTSTSSPDLLLPNAPQTIVSPPSSTSSPELPPTNAPQSTTTRTPSPPSPLPVSCAPDLILSNSSCVVPPSSTPVPTSTSPPSSAPIQTCGPKALALGLCATTPGPLITTPTSSSGSIPLAGSTTLSQTLTPSPPSPFIEPCGPTGVALGLCSPSTTTSSSSSSSAPSSTGFSLTSTSTVNPSLQNGSSSTLSQPTTGTSTPFGANYGTNSTSSSPPVIFFPTGTTDSGTTSTGLPSTPTSSPTFTPPTNTQYSYITATVLLGATTTSSSVSITMTNPDALVTTLSLAMPSSSGSVAGPVVPLPSDLPARIYPATAVDVPSGYTLCSILFSDFLSWEFVSQNTQSQGQIFAWMPVLINNALGISSAPVFALQVYVPAPSYQGPQDVGKLRTECLFYIPSNRVADLANQLKVASSQFYLAPSPYNELADQVDPAFELTSVPNPNAIPGSPDSAPSPRDKSRTNTIIGVVSALGGLALIILGGLVFSGIKRSRELRHRRLSDHNVPNDSYPDRTGRDFDQDSVGGQRRRSFYFAEDSLRGQQQMVAQSTVPIVQAQTQYVVQPGSQLQHSHGTSPENMRERRGPVVPGAISAPILTQSSLNW